jgi:hypothetical protein
VAVRAEGGAIVAQKGNWIQRTLQWPYNEVRFSVETMTLLIYLDVCCFNRPFDDQTQERVRLESEAVLLILGRCQRGELQLVGSEAIAL